MNSDALTLEGRWPSFPLPGGEGLNRAALRNPLSLRERAGVRAFQDKIFLYFAAIAIL
jgi:hypothetical protein